MLPRKVLLPPDPLHKPSSVITFFQDKVGFFFPVTLLSYASWLVTITGMNHQCTALSGSWQNICQPLITLHQVIRQSTMQTNACDCSKGSDEGKTEGMSFTHGDKLWECFMYKVGGWVDANQRFCCRRLMTCWKSTVIQGWSYVDKGDRIGSAELRGKFGAAMTVTIGMELSLSC